VNAFGNLERQLVESVASRARRNWLTTAGHLWRRWFGRSLGAVPAAISVLVLAVLVAATLSALAGGRRSGSAASPTGTAGAAQSACERCRASNGLLHGRSGAESLGREVAPGAAGVARAPARGGFPIDVRRERAPSPPGAALPIG